MAPKGSHWIETGFSARVHLGGAPVDCADAPGIVPPATTDAKVLVTLRANAKIVGTVTDTDGARSRASA